MDNTNGFTSVNGTANGHVSPPSTNLASPNPNTAAGTKRKREGKSSLKYYAVRVGKEPGIYYSWSECLDQVRGFPKAAFKSFTTLTDAEAFLKDDSAGGGGATGEARFWNWSLFVRYG